MTWFAFCLSCFVLFCLVLKILVCAHYFRCTQNPLIPSFPREQFIHVRGSPWGQLIHTQPPSARIRGQTSNIFNQSDLGRLISRVCSLDPSVGPFQTLFDASHGHALQIGPADMGRIVRMGHLTSSSPNSPKQRNQSCASTSRGLAHTNPKRGQIKSFRSLGSIESAKSSGRWLRKRLSDPVADAAGDDMGGQRGCLEAIQLLVDLGGLLLQLEQRGKQLLLKLLRQRKAPLFLGQQLLSSRMQLLLYFRRVFV